jgi:hypothetical protein
MIETDMDWHMLDLDSKRVPTCDRHHHHIRTEIHAFNYFMKRP